MTVDGTTYAFVASVQCGIYDAQGQYSISGVLPEHTSGEILDLAYSRDAEVHELEVIIGGVWHSTLATGEIESTISGRTVTGTATLASEGVGGPSRRWASLEGRRFSVSESRREPPPRPRSCTYSPHA